MVNQISLDGNEVFIGQHAQGLEQVDNEGNVVSATTGDKAAITDEKKSPDLVDEKGNSDLETGSVASSKEEVIRDARGLVTKIISLDDDPTLPVMTFRFWFLGIGLAIFGSVLAQIYYFKPQTILVSTLFLEVISYILGISLAAVIPTRGFFKYLNPGPFNLKEHAAIIIMASTASTAAFAIDVLAVDRLFYNGVSPSGATSVFTLLSSQLIGYGFAGVLRSILVYPTLALYPILLPQVSLFEALNKHVGLNVKRLRVFWIAFFALFFWEIIPQWIFPLLVGFSIFCLAQQKHQSTVFTNFFGGANGNEGLGFGSICFDWLYISGGLGPLWTPLQTQVNTWIGFFLCYCLFMGVFYNNAWNAQNYPFLAQDLFVQNGSSLYDQTVILDNNNEVDYDKLNAYGLPAYAGSQVISLLSYNLGISAAITHVMLFNWTDIKAAWSEYRSGDSPDPHYTIMQKYKEAPMWWYIAMFVISFAVAEATNYTGHSGLPWWSLIVAIILSGFFTIFTGVIYAVTGFPIPIQTLIQMIAGYMHQGKPIANMYFTLYGYNTQQQALLMLRDLKLGQYIKIPPRVTFTAQVLGTVIGSIFNYIMMNQIIDAQTPDLLNPVGSTTWSGQQPQTFNSQAITWALASELFSVGKPYFWVPIAFVLGFVLPVPLWLLHRRFPKYRFDYINIPVISWYAVDLSVGINSSIWSTIAIGAFSQFYMRKYRPGWFRKYNYILSAGLDGGTQVIVFVLTFAIFGASGKYIAFPTWAGNPNPNLDLGANNLTLANDYCSY